MTSSFSARPVVRLGVFYDGGWFSHLWQWLDGQSPWQAPPAFGGIHDVLRWYLHSQLGVPVGSVVLDCAHYVLGHVDKHGARGAGETWNQILMLNGITRHDALVQDGHERDADELLKKLLWSQARSQNLDVVALITGDGAAFTRLVHRLRRARKQVIVPRIDVRFQRDGEVNGICTPRSLTDAADHTPEWLELLDTALAPTYPLRFPFHRPVGGITAERMPGGYWLGAVNRWRPEDEFGFVTDRSGRGWYCRRDALPKGLACLPEGQPVTFVGTPAPEPGHKYPHATSVTPFDPDSGFARPPGRVRSS